MAVLQTALTEADARLVDVFQAYGSGRTVIVRKWEYIDATAADGLVAAVPATVVDPKADGQTYTGTYYVHTDQGEAQPDRSVTVIQILTSDGWFCYYDWTTKAGTAWTREWHKAATVLPVVPGTSDNYKTLFVTAGGNNNVSITQNADGTYDITATHQPSASGGDVFVGEDAEWDTYETETRNKPGYPGITQWREIKLTYQQKYHSDKSDAADTAEAWAGAAGQPQSMHGKAYPPQWGHGLWMSTAYKIASVGTWTDHT